MVSLDKCSGSFNSVGKLSMRICVPSKTKDVDVKVFNMITNRNESKLLVKHISCDCKLNGNSIVQRATHIKNGVTKHANENSKYLKSIVDDSKIVSDEIIYVMDIVSTNVVNTISTNMPTNYNDKKVQDKIYCYILHKTLLVIMLLLIIAFICYIKQSIGEN